MRISAFLSQIACFIFLAFSFGQRVLAEQFNDYSVRAFPSEGMTVIIIENEEKLQAFRGLIAGTVDIRSFIEKNSPVDLQMCFFLLSQEQELWARGWEGRGNLESINDQGLSVCKVLGCISALAAYGIFLKANTESTHASYARDLAAGVADSAERGVGDRYLANKMSVLLNGMAQSKDVLVRKLFVAAGIGVGCIFGFFYLDNYFKKQNQLKQRQAILKRIDLLIAELTAAGVAAEPAAQEAVATA